MKVSVLIPTYNRRHYVVDAVQSVLAQDYGDLEIVVVDDGSTDGTESALAPYRSLIRYIRTDNQGPAMARNTGMLAARGDYLAWLDSDDLYYSFKIRLQAQLLDSNPDVGMVYTEFSAFSDDGFWDEFHLKKYHASAYQRGGVEYDQLFAERRSLDSLGSGMTTGSADIDRWLDRSIYFGDIYEAYLFNLIVFTNSMMFRKSLLEESGLQRARFGMFHDLEFALRLCRNARVAFIDVPTYKLRYHPDQISTTRNSQGGKVAIRIQRDLLKVAEHHFFGDPEFCSRHEDRVRMQLAKLCRAAAIPLMAYDSGTIYESQRCSLRARCYLARCREYGRNEALLYALTFFPHIIRRIAFKLMRIYGALTSRKRTS